MLRRSDHYPDEQGASSSVNRDINGVLDRVYAKYRTTTGYGSTPGFDDRLSRRKQRGAEELSHQLDALRAMREQAQEAAELRAELRDLREEIDAIRQLRADLAQAGDALCAALVTG